MNINELSKCTAQQLLSDAFDSNDPIYVEDALTLVGSTLSTVHHQISKSQAQAIMRKIIRDEAIVDALRDSIEKARLNPDGNMPVDGAHPVDPAIALVKQRAVLPVLGALPPSHVILRFMRMAYDYVTTHG